MRKSIICIALLLACYSLNAQTQFRLPANLNTGSELIDDAFHDAFVIVRQSYALEDASGQRFGRGGASFFNSVDFLGVKTEDGILLFDNISTPWIDDDEFQPFKDKYKPYLSSSSVVDVCGKETLLDSLSINENNFQNHNDLWYCLKDSLFTSGLSISQSDTITANGWAIWISIKQDKLDKPTLHISKKELSKDKKGSFEDVTAPVLSDIVVGGLFVRPLSKTPGTLTFVVEAIMVRKSGTDWTVVPLHRTNSPRNSNELSPLSKNEK